MAREVFFFFSTALEGIHLIIFTEENPSFTTASFRSSHSHYRISQKAHVLMR